MQLAKANATARLARPAIQRRLAPCLPTRRSRAIQRSAYAPMHSLDEVEEQASHPSRNVMREEARECIVCLGCAWNGFPAYRVPFEWRGLFLSLALLAVPTSETAGGEGGAPGRAMCYAI